MAVAVREHNYYRDIHGVPHVASFSSDVRLYSIFAHDHTKLIYDFFVLRSIILRSNGQITLHKPTNFTIPVDLGSVKTYISRGEAVTTKILLWLMPSNCFTMRYNITTGIIQVSQCYFSYQHRSVWIILNSNLGFSMQTGHFTQVVWKASTEIGVGIATYPDSQYGHRTVVCINYRPPGNYLGQFEQNVPRPIRPLHLNYTLSHSDEMNPAKVMVL